MSAPYSTKPTATNPNDIEASTLLAISLGNNVLITVLSIINLITKARLGIDAVDNTSDIDKPISTLQQQAITDVNTSLSEAISTLNITLSGDISSVSTSLNAALATAVSDLNTLIADLRYETEVTGYTDYASGDVILELLNYHNNNLQTLVNSLHTYTKNQEHEQYIAISPIETDLAIGGYRAMASFVPRTDMYITDLYMSASSISVDGEVQVMMRINGFDAFNTPITFGAMSFVQDPSWNIATNMTTRNINSGDLVQFFVFSLGLGWRGITMTMKHTKVSSVNPPSVIALPTF